MLESGAGNAQHTRVRESHQQPVNVEHRGNRSSGEKTVQDERTPYFQRRSSLFDLLCG